MNALEQREYRRQRTLGQPARWALLHARTKVAWRNVEWHSDRRDPNGDDGMGWARLRVEWDDSADLSYLDVNAKDQRERAAAKRELDRAERDGCVGIIGEYWNGDEWVHVDSVWGFIGDDWKDSGYDYDVMDATLKARAAFMERQAFAGPV